MILCPGFDHSAQAWKIFQPLLNDDMHVKSVIMFIVKIMILQKSYDLIL